MRIIHTCIAVVLFGLVAPATQAQVMKEEDCLMQYLKGVQSNRAVTLVRNACNYLSSWSSSMELHKDERYYNECLLKELSGIQNDQAAQLMAHACYQKAYNTPNWSQ